MSLKASNHSEFYLQEDMGMLLAVCTGMGRKGSKTDIPCVDGSRGLTYAVPQGEGEIVKGVCMPSPCALGCSFDRELMREVGRAVGSMALEGGFRAVQSPDVGVVRSPLYGGLADCLGEDPYLNGTLASEWVQGVQSVGAAAVLTHFAGVNQSGGKFTCDSIIDKRALREIWLRPFEMTVKLAQPRAIYCGFNKINGLECGENPVLLTDLLRREWGFEGAVLADMRLSSDSADAWASGVDGCLPSGGGQVKRRLKQAVESGELPRHYPEQSAKRLREMTQFENDASAERMSEEDCRELARQAAEQCAVLLKNQKNTLPLPLGASLALIGRQAKFPRIQRGGMDAVRVAKVKNMLTVLDENQVRYQYCEGYDEDSRANDALLREAVKCAAQSEFAVIFAGFEDVFDNNSADRPTNQLPKAQLKLIQAVAKVNPNTVVVLSGSALPKLNWIGRVKSVLYMPLCGEEMCMAAFHLLFGFADPCGRLSVSYSLNESDGSCSDTFGRSERTVEYRESIYVGYRYYNKVGVFPAFPFGYGLSYTNFEYSKMRAVKCAEGWEISLDIKNIGKRSGAEVVQLYVEAPKTDKFRPVRELKQFHKVFLSKGEKRRITMLLPREALACYNAECSRFRVTTGRYRICAAASSADIRAEVWLSVKGEPPLTGDVPNWYLEPKGHPKEADFHRLFGKKLTDITPYSDERYSIENTLSELHSIKLFGFAERCIKNLLELQLQPPNRRQPVYVEQLDRILNMPLRRLSGWCHGLYPMKLTKLVLAIANRRKERRA